MKQFFVLVFRHLKCFFKDKSTFFFSLMVPVTTILIYYIMLRQMELGIVNSQISEVIKSDPNNKLPALKFMAAGLVDSWMLSGIIGLSCITVSMNTCYIVFKDREKGVIKDFMSSPVSPLTLSISYFAFNFILTFLICFILLGIILAIVCSVGALILTAALFFQILAAIIISIIVASLFTLLITSIMYRGDNYNFIISIFSAGLGFFIGAFMPMSMLGGIGYICCFIPGTYSVGLFRYLFLASQQTRLTAFITDNFSAEEASKLMEKINANFSFNIKFINTPVDPIHFWWILPIGGVIFALLTFIVRKCKKKTIA